MKNKILLRYVFISSLIFHLLFIFQLIIFITNSKSDINDNINPEIESDIY